MENLNVRQPMEADVVFVSEHRPMRPAGDPRDHPGIAALIKHGFDIEVLDDSIEYWGGFLDKEWTRKIHIQARISIEIDAGAREPDGDFLDWATSSSPSAAIRSKRVLPIRTSGIIKDSRPTDARPK
jgi:hypothetical protein